MCGLVNSNAQVSEGRVLSRVTPKTQRKGGLLRGADEEGWREREKSSVDEERLFVLSLFSFAGLFRIRTTDALNARTSSFPFYV